MGLIEFSLIGFCILLNFGFEGFYLSVFVELLRKFNFLGGFTQVELLFGYREVLDFRVDVVRNCLGSY